MEEKGIKFLASSPQVIKQAIAEWLGHWHWHVHVVTLVKSNAKHIVLSAPCIACVENVLADGRNGPISCINLFVAVSTITNTMGCYPVVADEDGPSRCYVSASLAYHYTESVFCLGMYLKEENHKAISIWLFLLIRGLWWSQIDTKFAHNLYSWKALKVSHKHFLCFPSECHLLLIICCGSA